MRDPRLLGTAVALVLAAQPLAAQGTHLVQVNAADCKAPKPPLGAMSADGTIQYLIPSDGRLDSSTVTVSRVEGATSAGFRDAVLRQLTRCRLVVAGPKPEAGSWAQQAIIFDSTTVRLMPALVLSSRPASSPMATVEAIDSTISYPLSSLDERPRLRSCKTAKGLYSRSSAPDMSSKGSYIRAQYQVDARGKVDPSLITFRDVNDPAAKSRAIAYYASCKYIPGRLAGIAVGAYLDSETWFDASGNPRPLPQSQ